MQKKNLAQLILGDWNTKTVVGVAIGAALFGVLMVYGGVKVFTNTNLTTAMLIPVIVGALFGPVPALVACFFGNVIADLIGGWGFWFDWSIGNGVLGFFVGLLPLYGADINKGIFTVKHAIIFAVIAVLGNALAFGVVTPLFTLLFFGGELNITFLQSLTGGASNVLVLTVLGIPLLFALAKRNASSQNLVKE
ncbi:MAG TPA: ECF-type riboflavin transporter substrate-binding protein [Erysipelotrichaceae bacterium]|jgi:energy-coupling factor transport system substrate-specific component|nr:ECF-type riboflavin transporter substrate-binding protein [Erysipelotrichaceae bacterium]